MKSAAKFFLFFCFITLTVSSQDATASGCINLSGNYTYYNGEAVQFTQNRCKQLTITTAKQSKKIDFEKSEFTNLSPNGFKITSFYLTANHLLMVEEFYQDLFTIHETEYKLDENMNLMEHVTYVNESNQTTYDNSRTFERVISSGDLL